MKEVRVLFLGAAKRVSLLERFITSAEELKVSLKLFSCEKANDFYPISGLATILEGPRFNSSEFESWLDGVVKKFDIDIVLPNMDSATVALSARLLVYKKSRSWLNVSSLELCQAMEDKTLSEKFFMAHSLPVPSNTENRYPKIAKPKQGFGAKGIVLLHSASEERSFLAQNREEDFLISDHIKGRETTVDFYIDRSGKLIGYVLRDRIEVSDGEVMVCQTRQPETKEKELIKKVAAIPGWQGCITLQYMRDSAGDLFIIEINPRLGGGVTASIEAGLDIPTYILSDFLNLPYTVPKNLKNLRMTRARRDFFQEIKNED